MNGDTDGRIHKIDATLTRLPENYTEWKVKAAQLLRVAGLWNIVDNTIPQPVIPELVPTRVMRGRPTNGTHGAIQQPEMEFTVDGNENEVTKATEDLAEWSKLNELAKRIIVNSLDASVLPLLDVRKQTASKIWSILEEHFIPNFGDQGMDVLIFIIRYKATSDLDISEWTIDMRNMRRKLAQEGGDLSDRAFKAIVLGNLPKTGPWDTFVQINRSLSLTPDALLAAIDAEYKTQNRDNPDSLAAVYTARAKAQKRRALSTNINTIPPKKPHLATQGSSVERAKPCSNRKR